MSGRVYEISIAKLAAWSQYAFSKQYQPVACSDKRFADGLLELDALIQLEKKEKKKVCVKSEAVLGVSTNLSMRWPIGYKGNRIVTYPTQVGKRFAWVCGQWLETHREKASMRGPRQATFNQIGPDHGSILLINNVR